MLFLPLVVHSQIKEKLSFSAELGSLISIGTNTYRTTVLDGLSTIISPKNYRFKYPSIRLRGATHYAISQKFHSGITAGINIRYLQTYGANKNKTTISIPIMASLKYIVISNRKIGLAVNSGIGHNFMNIKSGVYTDKGGISYFTGISVNRKRNFKNNVSYCIGYEHQTDNVAFIFPKPGNDTSFYNVKYKQFRNQLFVSVKFDF